MSNLYPICLAMAVILPMTGLSQSSYTQTLGPFQSVNSSTPFTFTATPPTTGSGKLVFTWGACFMNPPASVLRINFNTSQGLQQVVYASTTQACIPVIDSVTIPATTLADAIQTGGGSITGTLFITDYCVAGWGCTNFNDPEVFGMTLSYISHSANFTATGQNVCPGGSVQFTDQSINNPVSWEWQFPGGSPSISNLQNPVVTYSTPGSYDVTLIASDGNSSDTLTQANFINVYTPPLANAGADTTICSGDTTGLIASGGVSFVWQPDLYLSDDSVPAPLAWPVNSMTYTVTVTDANGCTGSDTVGVTVTPLPFIVTQAGTNPICLGDTTMIVAVGAQTYGWSPATGLNTTTGQNVFASPFNTTVYTVTGTGFTGCVNTDTITIVVNPLPPAPSITQLVATLYSSPAAGYQWFLNGVAIPGADQQTYVFSQNGIYTVLITDANGCQSLSLPYQVTNTGLAYTASATKVKVRPNPVTDRLWVDYPVNFLTLEVRDVTGRILLSKKNLPASENKNLDVSGLEKGTYLLQLSDGEREWVTPFMKL